MLWTPVLLLATLSLAAAEKLITKRWDDFKVKHAWVEVPKGWELHGPVPPDSTIDMRIGLKQNKFDELVGALFEVSDPFHPRYGQHLSKEEVDALVAPHPDAVDAVDSWLSAHGLDTSSTQRANGGSWITLTVTIDQASRMLNTTYNVYRHSLTDEYVVRTTSYSLPRILHEHIDVVSPTTYFSTMRSMRATSFIQPDITPIEDDIVVSSKWKSPGSLADVPSSCNRTITPACLRALYKTANYTPAATSKNSIGIAGYLSEFANRADLQTFFTSFRPDAVNHTFQTIQVNGGGDNQSAPGVEANLDIQYTEGMTFPTPNIYYSTGGSPPFIPDDATPTNSNEPYLDWLNFILTQPAKIPQTFTTSYGDDEQSVPIDYAKSVCNLFAQLGARGSSVMFSSGDFGVGNGDCLTNDGSKTLRFQPAFPASCPFVTTVGGTTRVTPEVGISFSGGGFSNYFARHAYTDEAVTAFLRNPTVKNTTLFNSSGRAYPDVSAQASGFQVVIGGSVHAVGGTSASSPTFAGVIALLNDFRISKGQPPLGFLNPLLYSYLFRGFNDITSGSNPGCGTAGFTAGVGWDPVTGLGTPDFEKLKDLIC